jgi:Domain of unknown function (DUF4349)
MRNLFLRIGLMLLACSCQQSESRLVEPTPVHEKPQPQYDRQQVATAGAEEQMPLRSSRREAHETTAHMMLEPPALSDPGQKLVRTAHLRLQVQDYEKSTRIFHQKIKARQAFVTDGTEERQGDNLENNLFIRVDNRYFDALLADLLQESIYLERKNIKVADVTEEYIDHQARLQTRKKVARRYLELLDKARNVKDILQVEQQLTSIQEEIEAAEARLRYLDHQVAYSTINLNYYEKIVPAQAPESTFSRQVAAALVTGWEAIRTTVLALLAGWPVFLVLIPAAVWTRRYLRRKRTLSI